MIDCGIVQAAAVTQSNLPVDLLLGFTFLFADVSYLDNCVREMKLDDKFSAYLESAATCLL